MSEDANPIVEQTLTAWQEHRFLVMIAGVIVVACFLVSVALGLYNSSGAAQVDLSRPDYEAIRNQAAQDNNDKSFDATGALDTATVKSFQNLYDQRAKQVVGVDSFDAAALSEDSLQLMSDGATPPTGN
jgi:hypothetical protein